MGDTEFFWASLPAWVEGVDTERAINSRNAMHEYMEVTAFFKKLIYYLNYFQLRVSVKMFFLHLCWGE